MLNIRTILVPTDFSDNSRAAWQLACALARDYGAKVIAVHVATPPEFVTYGELEKSLQPRHGYKEELEAKLRACGTTVPELAVDYWLEEGDPGEEILNTARETGCDLIIMGTHGRSGLGRLLMGSVAEKVLRHARCPVLTIRAPSSSMAN